MHPVITFARAGDPHFLRT